MEPHTSEQSTERRIRLPKELDAKLVYAAAFHGLSPSEILERILAQALPFEMPAARWVRVAPVAVGTTAKGAKRRRSA